MSEPTAWRAIPGYEGEYEVSDDGRVRNVRTMHVLRPSLNGPGYRQVNLHVDGVRKTRAVHALVAEAFIGPRPDGLVTRHLDGDELNNHPSNLVYGTPRDNALDAVDHGTHPNASKTHCKHGHEFTPENVTIRRRMRDGNLIIERRCEACRRRWNTRAWRRGDRSSAA